MNKSATCPKCNHEKDAGRPCACHVAWEVGPEGHEAEVYQDGMYVGTFYHPAGARRCVDAVRLAHLLSGALEVLVVQSGSAKSAAAYHARNIAHRVLDMASEAGFVAARPEELP